MFRKLNKKSEVTTQIFLYVMVVVVMGLALLLGYKYIKQFTEGSSQMSLDLFKKDLEDSINAISSNFGEVDMIELSLPTKFSKVCFVDKGENPNLINYPLIKSSVDAQTGENVFIMSKKIEASMKIAKLTVDSGPLCIENNAGKINLRLESLGDSVKITQAPIK